MDVPGTSRTSRRLAWSRIGVFGGLAVALVGALGLVLDWGSSAAAPEREGAARQEQRNPADEEPDAFLAAFVAAVRGGDTDFLGRRIAPAVIERYGAEQCRTAVGDLTDPTVALRLVGVSGPAAFDYASDGQSTSVDDVYTFMVEGTVRGAPATREYHFARVAGTFRLFADCGTPRSGP